MGDTSSNDPWSPTKDQWGIYECQSTTILHELLHFISYDEKRKWESSVMSPYKGLPDARGLDVDHIVDVDVTKIWTEVSTISLIVIESVAKAYGCDRRTVSSKRRNP